MMNDGLLDDSKFIQLIDSIQKLMNLYEQKMKDQPKIIILVGITGAGKSTVFNFLCGGNYTWQEIQSGSQLQLKENSEQFAMMNGGMNSVTKEPKYYLSEKYNHLIIDFPGFKDPNGELDQILIQMLFQKIVSKSKVKLIYVVRHPETRFNDRGVGLQDFIKILFQTQEVDLEKVCLLLNCYGDKLSDQALRESVRKQLQVSFKSNFKQISVIRKCKSPQDIQQIFSDEKRDQLMGELTQIQDIQFYPKQVQHSEKISQYLSDKNFQMYNSICEKLNNQCKEKVDKLQENQLNTIQNLFEKLVNLFSNLNSNIDNQYKNFIDLTHQIAIQLNCQDEIGSISGQFSKIFTFFFQFQDIIEGYHNCQNNQTLAQKSCSTNLEIIKQQISLLQKKKDLKYVENEKLNVIQQKQQAENQFQIESQRAQEAQQSVQNEKYYKDRTQQELTTVQNQKYNQQAEVNSQNQSYYTLQQKSQNDYYRLNNQQTQIQSENKQKQEQFEYKQSEFKKQQTEFDEKKRNIQNRTEQSKTEMYNLEREADNLFSQVNSLQYQLSNQNSKLSNQTQEMRNLDSNIQNLNQTLWRLQ